MSSGRPHSEFVDAMVLAARGDEVSRSFRIAELPRLTEFAAGRESQASFQGRFHLVDGRCGLDAQVAASLRMTCQRCLQPMDVKIDDRFHVVFARSEADMNELPEAQDSVIANAEHLDLAWLTEEQVLLALPLAPMHADEAQCAPQDLEAATEATRQMPFARLRELMNK